MLTDHQCKPPKQWIVHGYIQENSISLLQKELKTVAGDDYRAQVVGVQLPGSAPAKCDLAMYPGWLSRGERCRWSE